MLLRLFTMVTWWFDQYRLQMVILLLSVPSVFEKGAYILRSLKNSYFSVYNRNHLMIFFIRQSYINLTRISMIESKVCYHRLKNYYFLVI